MKKILTALITALIMLANTAAYAEDLNSPEVISLTAIPREIHIIPAGLSFRLMAPLFRAELLPMDTAASFRHICRCSQQDRKKLLVFDEIPTFS